MNAANKTAFNDKHYVSPHLSSLHKQLVLSDSLGIIPSAQPGVEVARNRLPAGQAAQFRKVSAPHALHRAEAVGSSALPRDQRVSASFDMRSRDDLTSRERVSTIRLVQTPPSGRNSSSKNDRDCGEEEGSKSHRKTIILVTPKKEATTPSRPSYHRAQTDGDSRSSRPSLSTRHSSPGTDLNRPLPPLPNEATPSPIRKLFRRKAVPPPLEKPNNFDAFDFTSYVETPLRLSAFDDGSGDMSASQFLKGTLKALEDQRVKQELTLQQELEDAIKHRGDQKEKTRVEATSPHPVSIYPGYRIGKADQQDLTASYTSDSSVGELILTPGHGSFSSRPASYETLNDEALAQSWQDYFDEESYIDELVGIQKTRDKESARMLKEKNMAQHATMSQTHDALDRAIAQSLHDQFSEESYIDELKKVQIMHDREMARRMEKDDGVIQHVSKRHSRIEHDNELAHVKSVKTHIQSTGYDEKGKATHSEPTLLIHTPTTGDPAWHAQSRLPRLSIPGQGQHNTVPIGSTEPGQTFVPSGRSFDVRSVQKSPHSLSPLEQVYTGPRAIESIGTGPRAIEQVNSGQPDIEHLRLDLRPMRTGDKVKNVVDRFEVKNVSVSSGWPSRISDE